MRQQTRRVLPTTIAAAVAIVAALVFTNDSWGAVSIDATLTDGYSEIQIVEARATSGEFRLRFGDGGPGVAETSDLSRSSTAQQVEAALNSLTNISASGGSVSVFSSGQASATLWAVSFDGGPLAGSDVEQLVAVDGTTPLTGPWPDRLMVDTISQAGVRRGDRRLTYRLDLVNNEPAVTTNPAIGDTLGCNGARPNKNWTPSVSANRPSGFGFRWVRNGETIAGETASSYVTTAADVGAQIQCLVTGISADGLSRATYASMSTTPTMVVAPDPSPLPPAPVSATIAAARPGISPASGAVGTGRTCTNPTNWTAGGTPVSFGYQWLRNGEVIDGQTASTYTTVAADNGKVVQCMVTGTTGTGSAPGGGKLIGISGNSTVGTVSSPPALLVAQTPNIVINAVAPTIEFELPAGVETKLLQVVPTGVVDTNNYWSCPVQPAAALIPAKAVCTNPGVIVPAGSAQLAFDIRLGEDAPDSSAVTARVLVPGADTVTLQDNFVFGPTQPFGFVPGTLVTELFDADRQDSDQAGAHPWAATARIGMHTRRSNLPGSISSFGQGFPVQGPTGHFRTLRTDLPAGFVGNALAPSEFCDDLDKVIQSTNACPEGSFVGEARWVSAGGAWSRKMFVALEPERGAVAQFAFGDSFTKGVYVLTPRLRPEDGYAVTVDVAPVGKTPEITRVGATICAYGPKINTLGEVALEGCKQPGDPDAFEEPLFTNPTACSNTPSETTMIGDSWESPGVFDSQSTVEPLITGCEDVPFSPSASLALTSDQADSGSGLEASISVPSAGVLDPDRLSQAHLKKTVVELPEGVSVNPSAATGLEGCTDEQLGLKTDSEPECPDGSKLGTVTATTPVLEETLTGIMVLRTPKSTDPMSGEMLRMALIVRNDERGILVKLPGSATADPKTGRLVATFDDNPQLPIGNVDVKLKGGDRGVLAMPKDCGDAESTMRLTPWSRAHLPAGQQSPATTVDEQEVDQRCENVFAPKLSAGNSDNVARGQGGTYSFRFSRDDGEQWLRGLTARLPEGLLASVRGVPLCTNGLADVGNCPADSKIGVVDAKAGSGDPFVLEEKGEVFLTEGYKGGEYGLAVKIRPVAGPFRGEHELSPIVVRQAIHVDRTTAEVTAVSDPFPLVHHGIPLRVREVTVLVNRGGFMVNPSDCAQKHSSATLLSDEGATAGFNDPFQVSGCANLAFEPKLTLALRGKHQVTTGKHPGIKAIVTQQGTSEAGIEQAVVRLPKSLALDPENAQALCEFVDGTKPDLENRCPKGSIVGRARAKTPLLKDDLVGNVYFVKNVRKDPVTGNEIRTLPMIVVALRGEIAINLKGESSTTNAGKLVNTFASVPDAPISQFNLNIKGGKTGIIAVTRTRRARINLCAGRHVAEADMDSHNGRRHDSDVRMKTPCSKGQARKAKRMARRAGR